MIYVKDALYCIWEVINIIIPIALLFNIIFQRARANNSVKDGEL